ncbi:MAG: UvrD-helicase domain-containing protein [Acidobacteriota bacterium]
MELTAQQSRAAHAQTSVVVTAGAGTGKTAMLAERFLHHVEADGLRPIEIVAVTFTEKAAAELRQRIRKTLADRIDDEEKIAEVDAAQISTIHALAARICRDFFYLVGISPDFKILLETESAIWLIDKFDAGMGEVDESLVRELGYQWLKDMIGQLLLDPHSASLAFRHEAESWKRTIDEERTEALELLLNSDAWRDATAICAELSGAEGDKLESARRNALLAMAEIEAGRNIPDALSTIRKLRAHLGQQGNWPAGCIAQMRAALKALKVAADENGPAGNAGLFFGPEDVRASEKVKLLEIAFNSVHKYLRDQKTRDRVLDFIDLELFAREVLEHEQARRHYELRWRAYLIDEFQDINPLQAEIIDLLRGDAKLTAVGDEKQSIYSFRRADIAVFREVRESIIAAGGDLVELKDTFRAHETLVASMNETFAPVLGELHGPLDADRKEAPNREIPLSLARVSAADKVTPEAARIVESKYVAAEIKRLLDEKVTIFDKQSKHLRDIEPRDIAILARTWAAIDIYIDALSAAWIPAVNAGGGSLLDTREAKDAFAMLSFLADTSDDISLLAVLRSPFFAIDDRTLFYTVKAKQKDQTWWNLLRFADGELRRAYALLLDLLIWKNKLSPEELLRKSDELTGYTSVIANLPQGDRREADWKGFIALLRSLAANGSGDLFGAVRQINALGGVKQSIPRPPLDAGDAVSLMTIHYAKGLEWPVVIVPDLAVPTGGWGDRLLVDSDIGIAFEVEDEGYNRSKPAIYELIKKKLRATEREEEKRLLYVAVTRARDQVILTTGPEVKKNTLIELLMPGIERANIPVAPIPFSNELAIPATPRDPRPFEEPKFIETQSVGQGLRTIPISGLTDYAVCPKKFSYKYVDGHPGLGAGHARARTIGTLTHKALELDIDDCETLDRLTDNASVEVANEALELARVFRSSQIFSALNGTPARKEVRVLLEHNNSELVGVADLVGHDFVLDFKTDAEIEPDMHRFQLWAYARGLNKPRAIIAYLRKPFLHEFARSEIARAEDEAHRLIDRIAAGDFAPTPAVEKCSRCVYATICYEAATAKPGSQLSLFA